MVQQNFVRINSGVWRGSKLPVLNREGLRPTGDRVKQTAFNWLTHQFGGFEGLSALDAAAGSGALGFEAASRGAASVICLEPDKPAFTQLQQNATRLNASNITLQQTNFERFAANSGKQFDVVFLDPPYSANLLPSWLKIALPLVKDNGLIYAENPMQIEIEGLNIIKEKQAGGVWFGLYSKAKPEA